MKLRAVIFALFTLIASPAAACPVSDRSQEWAGYWNAKNLPGVMGLYAAEPVFLPNSGERWSGPKSIRHNFAKLQKQFDPHLNLHSVDCEASGSLAYDSGRYDETLDPVKGGREIRAKGQYLFVFRRSRDGEWKLLEQTFTFAGGDKL